MWEIILEILFNSIKLIVGITIFHSIIQLWIFMISTFLDKEIDIIKNKHIKKFILKFIMYLMFCMSILTPITFIYLMMYSYIVYGHLSSGATLFSVIIYSVVWITLGIVTFWLGIVLNKIDKLWE